MKLLTSLVAVLSMAGCSGGDGGNGSGGDPDAGSDAPVASGPRVVRVVADGLWYPVTLELQHADGVEPLSVLDNGEFQFTTELIDGDDYRVVIEGLAVCILRSEMGVIAGADVLVELICDRVAALADLQVSGLNIPALGFTPEEIGYFIDVSLLVESAQLTPVAERPDAVSIAIARPGVGEQPVPSGQASPALALALDNNLIDIIVTHESGLARTYTINLRRAADIVQHVYGKASNTDLTDQFGISLALSRSGNTLAIGAIGEDSASTGIDGIQTSESQSNSGAVYVFTRQGLDWQQSAYIKSSNSSLNDVFGTSVALSDAGDVLAVGARWEDGGDPGVNGNQLDNSQASSGAVYVFRFENDEWAQEAYVKSSNPDFHDNFGETVALSGDGEIMAVGAPGEDSDSAGINGDDLNDNAVDSGAVYVFSHSHPWEQQAYIKASNVGASDKFGISLALSQDGAKLAVGAHWEDSATTGINGVQSDDSAIDSGAVYVFSRADVTWTQTDYIKASNTDQRDAFGRSVALSASGDVLAVGAEKEGSSAIGIDGDQLDNSARESGAVYLFRIDPSGDWTQDAYIKPSVVTPGDHFGLSVALSATGDTLAVGADDEDSSQTGPGLPGTDADAPESGAVYVFGLVPGGWREVRYVKASNTDADDYFGACVALSGDARILAVSAYEEDSGSWGIGGDDSDNHATDSGAMYIFY